MSPLTPIRELHRHRALFRQFSRRQIEARHRASFLGLAWTVLMPLISLSIYTVVFGFILGGHFTDNPAVSGETNLDYALGIFLGLILFNFIAEVLGQSPNTIVSQPNFVKKVVFPLEILPASTVGAAAFSAAMSLALALLGLMVFGHGLSVRALWLLVILPPVALIAFGCAWLLFSFRPNASRSFLNGPTSSCSPTRCCTRWKACGARCFGRSLSR
jgi:lipopolysaccharide transport system permease protein